MLPAHLNGIGALNSYEYMLHYAWSKDIGLACVESASNKVGAVPPIDCVVEWKDDHRPTLFTAGYILREIKETEMTVLAIYLKPDVQGYASLYGTLTESKKLLDRSIKIDSVENEIASRFIRLVLEQW